MTPQALIAVPPHEQPLITPSSSLRGRLTLGESHPPLRELRPLLTQSETGGRRRLSTGGSLHVASFPRPAGRSADSCRRAGTPINRAN